MNLILFDQKEIKIANQKLNSYGWEVVDSSLELEEDPPAETPQCLHSNVRHIYGLKQTKVESVSVISTGPPG